jgi:hypothetical protein
MRADPRLIGFTASSRPEAVSISERFDLFRLAVHSMSVTTPRSFFLACSSSEFLRLDSSPGSPFGPSFTCLGSLPSSRLHSSAATFSRRLPRPRFGPSSGFLNLSTFFSALQPTGLFHPAATSRVSPVQGLLSPCSHPSSSEGACPQAVGPARLTRLRRLPSRSDLDFEAFIRTRARSRQRSYSPRCPPLPSSGCSPPGPHFPPQVPAYPEPSTLDVTSRSLRLRARPQRPSSAYRPRVVRQLRLRAAGLPEFSSLPSASPVP